MAPDLLETACLRYKDKIPRECFLSKLPDWLQYCKDDVVSPSFDLIAEGNIKYIRASKYKEFVKACKAYAGDPHTAVAQAQEIELRVIIMPYMPITDAYQLHQLIYEPDILPNGFDETAKADELIENSQVRGDKRSDLGLAKLLREEAEQEAKNEYGEEELAAKWEFKMGSVSVDDTGAAIGFVVINYSTLWAKAEKYCMLMFMADPLKDFLTRLRLCDRLFHTPSEDMLHHLNDNLESAKRQLIFAMYENDVNPHDVIYLFYPDIHGQVYQQCVDCNPAIAEGDEMDAPETLTRLFTALNDLGLAHFDASLTVEKAQYNLMEEEGLLEAYLHQSAAMQSFAHAKDGFRATVQSVLHDLTLTTFKPTVMGVGAMDL